MKFYLSFADTIRLGLLLFILDNFSLLQLQVDRLRQQYNDTTQSTAVSKRTQPRTINR